MIRSNQIQVGPPGVPKKQRFLGPKLGATGHAQKNSSHREAAPLRPGLHFENCSEARGCDFRRKKMEENVWSKVKIEWKCSSPEEECSSVFIPSLISEPRSSQHCQNQEIIRELIDWDMDWLRDNRPSEIQSVEIIISRSSCRGMISPRYELSVACT